MLGCFLHSLRWPFFGHFYPFPGLSDPFLPSFIFYVGLLGLRLTHEVCRNANNKIKTTMELYLQFTKAVTLTKY